MTSVSVIIPNYNHALFLNQRIDSVLNQTFQDFELIILDDCSTDNSKEVIEQYRNHPKISAIVYNEQNSGSTFKQWQKGIELAKGEFIWIAESDDFSSSTFLEKVYSYIVSNKIRIAFSDSIMVDGSKITEEKGSFLLPQLIPFVNWQESQIFPFGETSANYFSQTCLIYNASSVIFHKSLIQYLVHSLPYKLVGDMAFWANIALKENIGFVAEGLNYFRTHASTVRSNVNGSARYHFEHLDFFLAMNKKVLFKESNYKYRIKIAFEHLIRVSYKKDKAGRKYLLSLLISNPDLFFYFGLKKLKNIF